MDGKGGISINRTGAKAARLTSYVFLSKVISLVIGGAALVVVARILGPTIYGVYTIAIAVVGTFRYISNLGISTALTKLTAEYSATRSSGKLGGAFSDALAALLVVCTATTALAFAASTILASYALHNIGYAYVLQIASLVILVSTLGGALNGVLTGFSEGRFFVYSTTVQLVVQSFTSIALAVAGFGALAPLAGFILGFAASIVLSLYLIVAVKRVRLVRPSLKGIKALFRFSLPIEASSMQTGLVANLSVIVLGVVATTAVVGNLGIATGAGSYVSILTDSISASLLPAFTTAIAAKRRRGNARRVYNYSVFMSLVLAVPILLLAALLSKQLIYTAFSGSYPLAPLYFSIVTIGMLIGIAGNYASLLLISGNRPKELLKGSTALTAVQLASIALLVPLFKGIGAVTAMYIITPVASVILFTYLTRRALGVSLDMRRQYRVLLSGLASTALIIPLIFLLDGSYVALLIAAAIVQLVAYPPILALTRGISAADIKSLKGITANLPVVNTVIATLADYSGRFVRS